MGGLTYFPTFFLSPKLTKLHSLIFLERGRRGGLLIQTVIKFAYSGRPEYRRPRGTSKDDKSTNLKMSLSIIFRIICMPLNSTFTYRIRRMGEGQCFQSVQTRGVPTLALPCPGGIYLGWGVPSLAGVPTLARGVPLPPPPDRTADGVLDTLRSVCLLRSRRTVLLLLNLVGIEFICCASHQ